MLTLCKVLWERKKQERNLSDNLLGNVNPEWTLYDEALNIIPTVSVVSFNILGDRTIHQGLYNDESNSILNINYRSKLILNQIQKLSGDIICLQEADFVQNLYGEKFKRMGYEYVFAPRNKYPSYGLLVGFKSQKFNLEQEYSYTFGQYISVAMREMIDPEVLETYENQSQVFQVVVLSLKSDSSKKFVIVNNHILCDPDKEHLKFIQISTLVEYLNRNFKPSDNIIICGDFNSFPKSSIIRFLTDNIPPSTSATQEQFVQSVEENLHHSKKMYQFMQGKHNIKFTNAYGNYDGNNNPPKYTTIVEGFVETLDFILYNPKSNLQLSKILKLPELEQAVGGYQIKQLPNKSYGSDHLPIMAEFKII